ncbi:MAG: MarR family transcriptional regulator [Actinomycetales bacterium]|nr:MarR family transcriptional regulator [Actinomycetales bacterium]
MTDHLQLFHDLVRLETELWGAVDARLENSLGLPLTWFEPMRVIDSTEGCRVNDIAEELRITIGGTSKLVDRIAAAGLCARRPNPLDGRSSVITLTKAGRARLADATAEVDDELTRLLAAVPRSALATLHSTLRRLRATHEDPLAQ